MKKYALMPIHDRRKSFYNKAIVTVFDDGSKVLTSYNTEVARITPDGELQKLWDGWSATTGRHIHEFLLQETGKNYGGKSAWLAM